MRRFGNMLALLGAMAALAAGCGDPQPPINRVGVNVVEKSAFTGSWYMHRTVIDMEYEAAPLDFIGDNANDSTGGFLGYTFPRIRWVIDEDYLYAYRDYEIVSDPEDPFAVRGDEDDDYLGQPVAAFRIESHFDIRRTYNSVTGEEQNVIVENTDDRHWYERQFMRVDWSSNLIGGYFGTGTGLSELFGDVNREPADLFVQDESQFPAEWRPQFHFMSCNGVDDTECDQNDRDWAADYDHGQLYSMSFVTQEILSPGSGAFGFPLCKWNEQIEDFFPSAPECASVAIWVRTSFLRVSDRREYEPVGWTNDRFDRAGYFALDRATYDRTSEAGDPTYGFTDFTNQSANRHNLWRQWWQHEAGPDGMQGTSDDVIVRDESGRPVPLPYDQRTVRPIVWYTTSELPAHLLRSSFEAISEWNLLFMTTIRQLRGEPLPEYQNVSCQSDDPHGYCYCQHHPDTGEVLNPECPGQYEPFESPTDAQSHVQNPFDCYAAILDESGNVVASALEAEPDWNDAGLSSSDFDRWFQVGMTGSECASILRVNTCNQGNVDEWEQLDCQQRGDVRFKFLSFVDQPGTPFLGVATFRGDPLTGEIIAGDANIGGPALSSYRTRALEAYDLINGNITEGEYYTGEDIRGYLNAIDHVELPAPPRIDFSVALRAGVEADPSVRAGIEGTMARAMERAEQLQGPEGRARVFSDRLQRLAGTDLERQLVNGFDGYAMAGMDYIPEGAGSESRMSEEILEMASPFRRNLLDRMEEARDFNLRLALSNMILPNEYTDDSVLSFVNEHRTWTRARLAFEVDRLLYRSTQIHELGHCMGLRHHFGASADPNNYFDGYYTINDQFPLPDPNDFNTDGTPGLSPDEQIAFEDAYEDAHRLRELAGIDMWMNSSIMEYTPNWYNRLAGAARYDAMAIGFGYGDIIDIYHNVEDSRGNGRAPLPIDRIHPVNTRRVPIKYYHGGESCTSDAECPFSASGSRSGELMQSNRDSGLVQTCVTTGRDGGSQVCSNFDDDAAAMVAAGGSPEWVPTEYFYCEDIRSSTRSLPGCAIFDEGDSYREIVRNAMQTYERDYLFSAFRRYRRTFSVGGYFDRLIRFLDPLLGIYQNLVYRYAADPAFREQEGPFGFYDEFLATADIMNMFARMLSQPSIGSYTYNAGWDYYELTNLDVLPDAQLTVEFGQGRYLNSIYQSGLNGIYRVERVGSIYDSILAMQLLTIRGLGPFYGPDVIFQTNFYDIFPNEMQQIFTGMIGSRPWDYMPRLECAPGSVFPRCNDPRIVYMDFYRGDCSVDPATGVPRTETCRPNPAEVTYRDLPVLNGGTRFFLQSYAAIFALANFPVYYDTSFQNQMFVCVEGQGDCFAPDEGAVEGVDYVRYTSTRFGQSFLAWQVDATEGVAEQTSIAFALVKETRDLDFIIRMLRTYRGDFLPGDPPPSIDHRTPEEQAQLAAIGYELPDSETEIQEDITRLDERLRSLESFFFYLIQLERAYGIEFPFLYQRPEI